MSLNNIFIQFDEDVDDNVDVQNSLTSCDQSRAHRHPGCSEKVVAESIEVRQDGRVLFQLLGCVY